jgi:alpha-ketoglutarate-dependent taurine dioxygenase
MPNSPSMPIYSRPADAALVIRPVTPAIGAEIHGVQLSGDLPADTMTAIRDALLRHRVVFFRGQDHLDEAGHQAFARLQGRAGQGAGIACWPRPRVPSERVPFAP